MPLRMMFAWSVLLTIATGALGQEPMPESNDVTSLPETALEPLAPGNGTTLIFDDSEPELWITGSYVFGWMQSAKLPALVTTSDPADPAVVFGNAGALGPQTTVLFGGSVNHERHSGFRLGAGYTFDADYGLGIEAGFLFLGSQSTLFRATSDEFAILARPYLDVSQDPDSQEAALVAFPAGLVGAPTLVLAADGSIKVQYKTGPFYDVNLDFTENIGELGGVRFDSLFGYRFAHISDGLRIRHATMPNSAPGTTLTITDNFDSSNSFHGLDLGVRATMEWHGLSLSLLSKLAAGHMQRAVTIRGTTTPTPAVGSGGLYALVTNSGKHESSEWSVVPEFGANLKWQVRSNVAVRLGYSGIFLQRVVRADDHLDLNVHPDLLPGPGFDPDADPQRPRYKLNDTNLWIQTLNVGVDFTF